MWVTEARLQYFCQHRDRRVTFAAPGMNAIIGRNGAGKSNLLKGIYAAVTGDFGRNDGVKTDNISQYAAAADQSIVSVVMEHAGSSIHLSRSLRPSRCRLEIVGEHPVVITKASEINDVLASVIGVSAQLLSDYIFVDQWSIFDFLSLSPAERSRALQRLFKIDVAEKLWQLLGKHRDAVTAQIPTTGVERDIISKRIASSADELIKLEEKIGRLTDERRRAYAAERRVKDHETRVEVEAAEASIRSKLSLLAGQLDIDKAQLTVLLSDEEELKRKLEIGQPARDAACRALADWARYEADRHTRRQEEVELFEAERRLARLAAPNKPSTYVDDGSDPNSTWWREHRMRVARKHALESTVAGLGSDATSCPLCGATGRDFACRLADYVEELSRLTNLVLVGETAIRASELYRQELAQYTLQAAGLRELVSSLKYRLSVEAEPIPAGASQEELKSIIDEYARLELLLRSTASSIGGVGKACECTSDRIRDAEVALAAAEQKRSVLPPAISLEEYAEAKVAIRGVDRLLLELNAAETKAVDLRAAIASDSELLCELERRAATADIEREWLVQVDTMRAALHRDNLPRLIAQRGLEEIHGAVNDLLVQLESPFSVTVDDSLSFVAHFRDGRVVPAGRLSGGEKVMLAVAFRVAVNSTYAGDLGLLCLDEPMAGLDEGNVHGIKTALERLQALSKARGLQVIMVTHERSLPFFDKVIDLG